jgi:hypothetical protein
MTGIKFVLFEKGEDVWKPFCQNLPRHGIKVLVRQETKWIHTENSSGLVVDSDHSIVESARGLPVFVHWNQHLLFRQFEDFFKQASVKYSYSTSHLERNSETTWQQIHRPMTPDRFSHGQWEELALWLSAGCDSSRLPSVFTVLALNSVRTFEMLCTAFILTNSTDECTRLPSWSLNRIRDAKVAAWYADFENWVAVLGSSLKESLMIDNVSNKELLAVAERLDMEGRGLGLNGTTVEEALKAVSTFLEAFR